MRGLLCLTKLVLILGLVLSVKGQAQGTGEDKFAPRISPSLLFRLDWLSTAGIGIQVAAQAKGELPHQGGAVFFDGAVWFSPPTLGLAVLEFYEAFHSADLEVSFGKRAKLVGPWREGVLGYDGLPGLFVGYPLQGDLGLEGAVVLEEGLLRTYVGGTWNFTPANQLQFGVLLRPSFSPRVVFQTDIYSVGVQTDRGVWGDIDFPVNLLEGISLTLEGSVWWQPGFVDNNTGGQTFVTQRFFLGLGARIEDAGFGVEVVRAPLEAYRLWLEYRLKF